MKHIHLQLKQIIEALLFSSADPLPFKKIKEITDAHTPTAPTELKELIEELKREYQKEQRGYVIDEIAGGYLFRTIAETAPFVSLLHRDRRGERLSKAAMEVVAIIAYKQPITRAEIDRLRGVDSAGSLHSLLERGLIEVTGKLMQPGRPSQYGVTKRFLQHFGLKHLDELPSLPKESSSPHPQ